MAEQDDATDDAKPQSLTYFAGLPEQRFVSLGDFGPMEAQMVRLRLQGQGIRCSLANEEFAQLYSGILGSVKIEVLEEDLERARELLRKPPTSDETAGDPDEGYVQEDWRCPKCHKRHVQLVPLSGSMLLLSVLTAGIVAVLTKRERYCQDCGHRWKPLEK